MNKKERQEYMKEYNQQPEVKQRMKEYNQQPEVKIKEHYLKQKIITEKALKQFRIPPIPLEGKLISINNILNNIAIIEKHVDGLNATKEVKKITLQTMLKNLMENEGLLVSKRKELKG